MNPDLFFAAGIVILVLAIPAMFTALTEGRAPRLAALALLVGGSLLVLGIDQKPGGYSMAEVPGVLAGVASRLVN